MMDTNQRELLRDNIASTILAHYHGVPAPLTQARIAADAVMSELFGGAYVITTEGRDYLADHRHALGGGKSPAVVGAEFSAALKGAQSEKARRMPYAVVSDNVSYRLCAHGYRICSECGGPNPAG